MAFGERILGEFRSSRGRWALIGVVVLGAILRFAVCWQPVQILLMKNLPDDAYYYFVLAHNAVRLDSVSMDGVNVTNGFHPLWWLMVMPIFGWEKLADLQVTLALTLASVLDLATIWITGQLAASLTRRESLGVLAAGLYAANPIVILQVTNGLETSAGMLALAVFLLVMKRWLTRAPTLRFSILAGFCGGLLFLARSDSVLFLGLVYLTVLWYWRKDPKKRMLPFAAGIITTATVLPWFIWGQLAVGSWMQESGVAVPYASRVRLALEQGTGVGVFLKESASQLLYPPMWIRGDYSGLPFIVGSILWTATAAGLVWRWRPDGPEKATENNLLLPLLGSGVLLVLVHAGLRWYPRTWYFIPVSLAFAIAFVVAFKTYLVRSPRTLFLVSVAFAVYFTVSGFIFWQIGYYPWQSEMVNASEWMGENIPADAKVASFNSGIYTYYNDFTVLNLDGVVNHQAYEAVKSRSMFAYLQQSGVDYLVDYDSAIRREYAPFMGAGFPEGLEEAAVLGGSPDGELGLLRIYRVIR